MYAHGSNYPALPNAPFGCRARSTRVTIRRLLPGRPAVVLREIGGDGLDVLLRDRRAEGVDHLVDRRGPPGLVEEARIHLDVIEAVACDALHRLVLARRVLQLDLGLLGCRGAADRERHDEKGDSHTTSTYSRW